jgi:hypothetical protein
VSLLLTTLLSLVAAVALLSEAVEVEPVVIENLHLKTLLWVLRLQSPLVVEVRLELEVPKVEPVAILYSPQLHLMVVVEEVVMQVEISMETMGVPVEVVRLLMA